MDDFSQGGAELREALHHLRKLNSIFAAASSTLFGVQRLWELIGKPRQLSILDIGAGSGDVNRLLLSWADKCGINLKITLVDITEEACEEAKQLYAYEPRVQVKCCNLFELPEQSADLVTATQFVHHFSMDELPVVIQSMLKASTKGIVINDIHRHWVAWSAVWMMTRTISKNRYIRHDGPLSVAKGFRRKEWKHLQNIRGMENMLVYWRPLFRYVVIMEHNSELNSMEDGGNPI